MFSRMEKAIKDNNPASYTGMFTHTLAWITASSGDFVYQNPHCKKDESNPDDLIDIYCVHGTADRAGAFKKIAERLLAKQLPSTIRSIFLITFDGRYQGKSIEFFSEQLLTKILANKSKHVILMGHSRGGLVNARFAEYLAASHGIRVDRQFGFGTPWLGSELALAPLSLLSSSVGEMSPGSPFLKELKAKILTSASRYYFVVAPDDYIVGAGRSHIAEYVEQHPDSLIELETAHGHISMMTSQKLVERLHTILCTAPARAPESAVMFHPLASIEIVEEYPPPASTPSSSSSTADESDDDCSLPLFEAW